MRVKIGESWHQATPGAAVMIELTAQDRLNIAAMLPEATKYATFANGDPRDADAMLAWMDR